MNNKRREWSTIQVQICPNGSRGHSSTECTVDIKEVVLGRLAKIRELGKGTEVDLAIEHRCHSRGSILAQVRTTELLLAC